MITPSSNTSVEPITEAIRPGIGHNVTTYYTRVRVKKNSMAYDAQAQFALEQMVDAAALLNDAAMDSIVWNGTSGGWLGLDSDREMCAAIEQETGVPAGTGFLAIVEAMQALDVKEYALVSPYEQAMDDAIVDTLTHEGFRCIASPGLGITDNLQLGYRSDEQHRQHVREAARKANVLVVPCTNYAVSWVVE